MAAGSGGSTAGASENSRCASLQRHSTGDNGALTHTHATGERSDIAQTQIQDAQHEPVHTQCYQALATTLQDVEDETAANAAHSPRRDGESRGNFPPLPNPAQRSTAAYPASFRASHRNGFSKL